MSTLDHLVHAGRNSLQRKNPTQACPALPGESLHLPGDESEKAGKAKRITEIDVPPQRRNC